MSSCYTNPNSPGCRAARRNGYIAIAAVAVVGIMVFGVFIYPALSTGIHGPSEATGQAIYIKVPFGIWGGSQPTTGRADFFDTRGVDWGGNVFSSTGAGILTAGPIASGYTYTLFYNGTGSVGATNLPFTWNISIPEVTGLIEPANYYKSLSAPGGGPFVIYRNATAYSDTMVDVTSGALSGAIRTNSGSTGVMANDTITHNVDETFQYTVTVSSAYTARMPSYFNPAYPDSGRVSGFVYLITNSTNAYVVSGAYSISLASYTIFIIPINMVIAGASSASQTVMFTLRFPTACYLTVYGGTVWNTNLLQLQNAKSTSWSTLSAPTGYTVCKMQLLGNAAGKTYCLWTVS